MKDHELTEGTAGALCLALWAIIIFMAVIS
jgi:hypothetical protein